MEGIIVFGKMDAMESALAVPVSEYLQTGYEPDMDYVDGVLEDRNVGEKDHSSLHGAVLAHLFARRRELGIHVYPELRLKVSEMRYRVSDICIFTGPEPEEQVPSRAPFLCIEILSPEDRMTRIQAKIRDFFRMGVEVIWVIDPQNRSGWIYTPVGAAESAEGLFTAGPISVRLSELDQ
jgi:Uma2 family endonuclease